jgi:hypothetical protein
LYHKKLNEKVHIIPKIKQIEIVITNEMELAFLNLIYAYFDTLAVYSESSSFMYDILNMLKESSWISHDTCPGMKVLQ